MWAALVMQDLNTVYTDQPNARAFTSSMRGYTWVPFETYPDGGLAYGCHPEYGDLLAALNRGLEAFKGTASYRRLCDRYGSVSCDCNGTQCVEGWSGAFCDVECINGHTDGKVACACVFVC